MKQIFSIQKKIIFCLNKNNQKVKINKWNIIK